jgi:hypothetical protein
MEDKDEGKPIEVKTIGSGEMKKSPSWSDINTLIGRIESLEHERGHHFDEDDVDDVKENTSSAAEPPELRRRSSAKAKPRGLARMLMTTKSQKAAYNEQLEEVERKYDEFELPESTYTFLIAEPILSTPFFLGCISYALCLTCLALALYNELDNGTDDNPYAIAEVRRTVRVTQFLGLIIGVLMDDEIPTGLELIGKALEQDTSRGDHFSMFRIICSSILRISIGAMFLTSLFFIVIQEDTVIGVFFDVLALEFVESIDDVIFELCRRGFFSRRLKLAANQEHAINCSSGSSSRGVRKWSKRIIRFVYFSTIVVMCVGLSYITAKQPEGTYGCTSIMVRFGDEVWEDSWVELDQQCTTNSDCSNGNQKCFQGLCHEPRLLIYSHFNGRYTQDGTIAERPRYVEMNKEKGEPYKSTIPAEIIYCEDIEAWVLMHPKIKTSVDSEDQNECQWLLRSEQTEDFDIEELSEGYWRLWDGKIVDDYKIDIDCAECANDSHCNYMGTCVEEPGLDQSCECFPGRFGVFCQFETPCDTIRSEKDPNTTLTIVKDNDQDGDSINFVNVYGRPMYYARMSGKPYSLMRDGYPGTADKYFEVEYPAGVSGTVAPHKHNNPDDYSDDDFFEIMNEKVAFQELMKNYTFVLRYTGSRWYGQIIDPNLSASSFKEEEFHAFWMNTFSGTGQEDNSTLIISDATDSASPAGVDFFEMRRRNKAFEGGIFDYDYGPYGVMIPLVEQAGAGFFHCNKPN